MRDQQWLIEQLNFLLDKYFKNVPLTNPIEIKFGREAKFRFGSIKLIRPKGLSRQRRASPERAGRLGGKFPPLRLGFAGRAISKKQVPQKSLITITAMFRDEAIPVGVVRYTVAHELCHYAHGFSSTNKRLFRFPHHGGVINKELKDRGAEELIPAFKNWLAAYRRKILAQRVRI